MRAIAPIVVSRLSRLAREDPPMPTSVFDSLLLGHVWGTDELRAIFSDENRVQKWFDYEAALALAQAELGIVPPAAAAEIAARAKVANVDLAAIGAEIRRIKHPLVPALRALQAACADDHGEYLHFGPTTQDVLDTGMVLQLKEAHAIILRDLRRVGRELLRLAETHKATPMAGRTHGVQALPITFGHKCAIWLAEAGRNFHRLVELAARTFVGSLTGAVGTQASFGARAFELDANVMARLDLGVADISWQTARDRLAEYAGALGLVGGALRASVALMQEALVVEHERDASTWRLEWKALPEACLMTGAMLAQMRYVLGGLEVFPEKMRRNLDTLGGFLMSERVMFALADKVGKQSAHEIVYEVAMRGIAQGVPFERALMADAAVRDAIDPQDLAALLDPTTYVGLAPAIVERVVAEARASGWTAT